MDSQQSVSRRALVHRWSDRLLNVMLCALVATAVANLCQSSANSRSETINTVLLLISGFVINLGTIIQFFSLVCYGRPNVQLNYTKCLVVGCLLLVLCQVYSYVRGQNANFEFLCTLVTSAMSLTFTLAMCIATWSHERLRKTEQELEVVLGGNASKPSLDAGRIDRVTFVEGTSGIGKTTFCDQSIDYTRYLESVPLFMDKHKLPYLQSMYEARIYVDLVRCLLDHSSGSDLTVDRCFVSQFAYSLLFHFEGHMREPKDFAHRVDLAVFRRPDFCFVIRDTFRCWLDTMHRLAPQSIINIQWFGAADVAFTVDKIKHRGGFENDSKEWNLENYVVNQNYVFASLQKICGIGEFSLVRLIK